MYLSCTIGLQTFRNQQLKFPIDVNQKTTNKGNHKQRGRKRGRKNNRRKLNDWHEMKRLVIIRKIMEKEMFDNINII